MSLDPPTGSSSERLRDLDAFFAPRSIAVFGASDDPMSPGGNVIRNLVAADYPGAILPVSARRDTVVGLTTTSSIAELPSEVDLAVVAIPAEGVPTMLRSLAERGTRGALILSSGFSETGHADLQHELVEVLAETGIRACGPNCAGFLNLTDRVSANSARWSPIVPLPRPGAIAIVSQSGGFANFMVRRSVGEGLGVSWFISTGNEADICVSTAIEYVVRRPEVEVVAVFAETINDSERFVAAAETARQLDKPVVVLKAGRSDASARAALSHTASITGSSAAFDAVCRQHGIHVADGVDDLVDLARMFATPRRASGRGVGILTASGGVGVALADAAGLAGLEVPEFTADDRTEMQKVLPENFLGSLANPVDMSTQAPVVANPYESILGCMASSPVIDLMMPVIFHYSDMMVAAARTAFAESQVPMAVVSTGAFPDPQPGDPPVYTDPRRAARALAAVARQSERGAGATTSASGPKVPEWATAVSTILDAGRSHPFVLESDALRAFSQMGIPTATGELVATADEAGAAFDRLGGRPVAVKVMSYDIAHKTELGAVRIGLASEVDVVSASHEMLDSVRRQLPDADIEGLLVQAMAPARLELTCGLHRDETFGPMVVIGVGGTMIELLAETVMLRAPFDQPTARAAVSSLLDGRIVSARRGLDTSELTAIAAIAAALGQLALLRPDIESIDINPLRIADGAVVAVDALVVWGEEAAG